MANSDLDLEKDILTDDPNNTEQLEQYGVWVKAGPETVIDEEDNINFNTLSDLDDLEEENLDDLDFDDLEVSGDITDEEETLLGELQNEEAEEGRVVSTQFDEVSLDDFAEEHEQGALATSAEGEDELSEDFLDIDLDFDNLDGKEFAEPKTAEASSQNLDLESVEEIELDDFLEEKSLDDLDMETPEISIPARVSVEEEGHLSTEDMVAESQDETQLEDIYINGEGQEPDFDDLKALEEELTEEVAHPTPGARATEPASDQLLKKIEGELSTIREELQDIRALKAEIAALRNGLAGSVVTSQIPVAPSEDEKGFFDEEEDETIALTGDELDNILTSADIKEEQAEGIEGVEEIEQSIPDDSFQDLDADQLILEEESPLEVPEQNVLPPDEIQMEDEILSGTEMEDVLKTQEQESFNLEDVEGIDVENLDAVFVPPEEQEEEEESAVSPIPPVKADLLEEDLPQPEGLEVSFEEPKQQEAEVEETLLEESIVLEEESELEESDILEIDMEEPSEIDLNLDDLQDEVSSISLSGEPDIPEIVETDEELVIPLEEEEMELDVDLAEFGTEEEELGIAETEEPESTSEPDEFASDLDLDLDLDLGDLDLDSETVDLDFSKEETALELEEELDLDLEEETFDLDLEEETEEINLEEAEEINLDEFDIEETEEKESDIITQETEEDHIDWDNLDEIEIELESPSDASALDEPETVELIEQEEEAIELDLEDLEDTSLEEEEEDNTILGVEEENLIEDEGFNEEDLFEPEEVDIEEAEDLTLIDEGEEEAVELTPDEDMEELEDLPEESLDFPSEEESDIVDLPQQSSSAPELAQPKLKEEIKSVLTYMDKLLESLPEDKIKEFAESPHFEVYKNLFEELGLTD